MTDAATTWQLIHHERAALIRLLESLTSQQWTTNSLCGQWTVQVAAAHVLAGAEQTPATFTKGMLASGFRFDTMIDRQAHRLGELATEQILDRLRVRTTTTNHPPGPIMAMLGEVVVHSLDISQPLGLPAGTDPRAALACLQMYRVASFPVGGKKRIQGLRLVATDLDWSCGDGPEVSGPATALLLAMTGRKGDGLAGLAGDGADRLRNRVAA